VNPGMANRQHRYNNIGRRKNTPVSKHRLVGSDPIHSQKYITVIMIGHFEWHLQMKSSRTCRHSDRSRTRKMHDTGDGNHIMGNIIIVGICH